MANGMNIRRVLYKTSKQSISCKIIKDEKFIHHYNLQNISDSI